ncbi:MAG: branched-chain amino acid ABC transporter ATP-binding protein/permease, partial [Acidimicrobiia bacterium]|nr:branched-chain amino acid ABC transporter ATP-binding protein/permease [Acidimicrobiia bacterium]
LPMTLLGGVGVGNAEKIVRDNVETANRSIVDLILFGAVVVAVLFAVRARRDEAGWSLSPKLRAVPREFGDLAIVRHLGTIGLGGIFLFLGLLGWLLDSPTSLWLWTGILIHTMVALSLTLLTGWAGQISLGQFAFVGLGAFCLVALTKGHDIPIPLNAFDLSLTLNWGVAVVLCTLIGALAALIIGVPALRVRGLFLAVATLAFAVASANWILAQDVFTGGTTAVRPVSEPVLGPFDFGASRKSFYFLCLGFLIVVTVLLARLRRTGIGRSLLAVRENEEMAAASTVSVTRMKIMGFAIAGAVAALAGALYGTLQENLSPANTFAPEFSIDVVAISVIGGLGSIAGPFLGVLWVKGIPALFDPTAPPESIRLVTSGIGLLLLLLYLPGGLVQFLYNGRDTLLHWISRSRFGARASPPRSPPLPVTALAAPPRPAVPDSPIWLRTQALSVSFGGNRAVRDVDFEVRRGELVGLIGTNGAGKSTLMNAVSGFVPASGTVELLGIDVSDLRAHARHRLGLGRTFQAARLYPDLTVTETLMVALEARRRSLLLPSLLGVPPSPGAERQKRAEAAELVDYLGLGDFAGYFVSELSTGTRRVVELGCMLASGARVLMLDEPTGGLSQRETEEFGPRIKEVQTELDAAVVVIEHDVPLVMGISDRMYCLEAGSVISVGTPDQLRADPAVIASYLGSDERLTRRNRT